MNDIVICKDCGDIIAVPSGSIIKPKVSHPGSFHKCRDCYLKSNKDPRFVY
jgi:hypothetical protein